MNRAIAALGARAGNHGSRLPVEGDARTRAEPAAPAPDASRSNGAGRSLVAEEPRAGIAEGGSAVTEEPRAGIAEGGSAVAEEPRAGNAEGGSAVTEEPRSGNAEGRSRIARRTLRATVWPASAELVWIGGFAAGVLALCALPYALAALWGPAELERLGTFWFSRDFSQYQAAMREGARSGGWLIHDHFSAEPHSAVVMYPLYVAAGKLAASIRVADTTVFAALEWLGRISLVGALYWFAATFVSNARTRRLAVLLAVGTLGLDVWGVAIRAALHAINIDASFLPREINPYLEVSSFGVLLSAPHLMFGLALTLACAPLYLRAIAGSRVATACLPLAALALSLVHAFNAPVLASVLVLHALVTGRRAWLPAGLVALAVAPMVLYSVLVYSRDPFWSGTYGAQNLMPAPPAWALPFDFGLVLIAAPLAWPVLRTWPRSTRLLVLLWIGLGLAWMYAPVAFQRRLSFGVQPALALLAAIGLLYLNAWMRTHAVHWARRRVVNYVAALAAASTSLLVYVALLSSALFDQPSHVYLWTRAEATAAAWLGEHSTVDDVVLASTTFANPMVGAIDGRVVQGHNVATLRSRDKEHLVWSFFAAATPPSERARLLADSGATIVAFGPHELVLGATSLDSIPGLIRIYDRDGVSLYRVDR